MSDRYLILAGDILTALLFGLMAAVFVVALLEPDPIAEPAPEWWAASVENP